MKKFKKDFKRYDRQNFKRDGNEKIDTFYKTEINKETKMRGKKKPNYPKRKRKKEKRMVQWRQTPPPKPKTGLFLSVVNKGKWVKLVEVG